MFKRLAVLLTGFVIVTAAGAEKPRLASFVGPGGPWGIWKKSYNRRFPVEIIFKDLADIGLTDIYFPDQNGRGGPFLHPTKIAPAKVAWQMGERDHLKEVLEESAKYGMRVWLMWTTPGKEYPDSEIHGLNDPRMIKLYCDLIDEVAANYGHY